MHTEIFTLLLLPHSPSLRVTMRLRSHLSSQNSSSESRKWAESSHLKSLINSNKSEWELRRKTERKSNKSTRQKKRWGSKTVKRNEEQKSRSEKRWRRWKSRWRQLSSSSDILRKMSEWQWQWQANCYVREIMWERWEKELKTAVVRWTFLYAY